MVALWSSSPTKEAVSRQPKDIDTWLTKAWTAIDKLSVIWKSDLTDKIKRSFFQSAVVSILLYGCTTWTLTKRIEKKLDGNYTKMLRAILNKSWKQHHTKHKLECHLSPITKTIKVWRTRHAGHCWKSSNELISEVLLWTPTYGRAKAGRPARTYIQYGEKTLRQIHKNAASNFEQVLEATPHKSPTIRPPTTHHENYQSLTNQTCKTLLEKQRRAHKWCTPMDPLIWPSKSRTTSSNLHTAALWVYEM